MRFLRSSLTKDQITTVQRWFGLHLVYNRIQNPEKLMYFWGSGGNGKSVIINLLQGLLTPDAIAAVTLDDLRTPANVERLVGKMAMIGTEGTSKTDCSVNEILKRIVSRENINVNPKYRDPFNLMPECLVTQASNNSPRFDDDSDAMVRRVIALHLEYTPTEHEKILGIAELVRSGTEYPHLVAFALQGAIEIMAAGTIEIPDSVKEASELTVRPVRTVDRFVETLETGNFEVADEELYVSYSLMCKRQVLKLMPRKEFLADFVERLKKHGYIYHRRAKATHYVPQAQLNDRGVHLLLAPQLREAPHVDIFMGIRIRHVEHGLPIGGPIHHSRRETVDYEHLAALAV
jgi:phage/plasmid-associated DNA primase